MSRRRSSRRGRNRRRKEDVNPMNGLSNLSDAMLILAVGIMLALIVHWNVDISTSGGTMTDEGMSVSGSFEGEGGDAFIDEEEATTFTEQDIESVDSDEVGEGEGMEDLGRVYFDHGSGKYYILPEDYEEEKSGTD